MKKKLSVVLFMLCFGFGLANALVIQEYAVRGVRPSDRVSSLEFNPEIDVSDDSRGESTSLLTVKYYQDIKDKYSIGIEVPGARYESPEKSRTGLGDILLAASYTQAFDNFSMVFLMENTLPTATDDTLGTGKWYVDFSAAFDISFTDNIFFATGYKYYVSILGDDSRNNINRSRVRGILGYMTDSTFYVLLDNLYHIDFENSSQAYILDVEFGMMLENDLSLYIKPGWQLGGAKHIKDWSLSFGVKLLNL
ncbi:MAG: hypothetical protein LBM71_02265 [Elusimicrobiota bacterium]|jgi:hypothetical protein|nr:hypothetical protein [Elusimicrobiota bacterium]